jgi:hypothetical protein
MARSAGQSAASRQPHAALAVSQWRPSSLSAQWVSSVQPHVLLAATQ